MNLAQRRDCREQAITLKTHWRGISPDDTALRISVRRWIMRSSSCQVEFGLEKTDTVRRGRPAVADCVYGVSICADCRMEC
jgi:hypothetical protein